MKLRRAAVHKAQPIKHYKPMEVSLFYHQLILYNIVKSFCTFSKVKPSTKPLTQPEPPHLQVNMSNISFRSFFFIFVRTNLLHICENKSIAYM